MRPPILGTASLEREIATVRVDVLPQQRDLDGAPRRELAHLGHDFGKRPADFRAPDCRDNAKRTVVIAADLDRHPCGERQLATNGESRSELLRTCRSRLEDLDLRAVRAGTLEEVCGMPDVVSPKDSVNPRRPLQHFLPVFLGKAAAYGDLHPGPELFERAQLAQVAVEAVVCVLADAARVENDDVGILDILRRDQTLGFEEAGQTLGIVLVHLAAKSAHMVTARRFSHALCGRALEL